jgi:flagellar biosynthesis protein FlhA
VKRHAPDLVGRQEVQALLDNIKEKHSVVIEELIPNVMTLGAVQRVMSRLLRERASIRDLGTILETLADHAPQTKSVVQLTERVRQALGRALSRRYTDEKGTLRAATLDLDLERTLLGSIVRDDGEPRLVLKPELTQALLDRIGEAIKICLAVGEHAVILCTQGVRPHLFELVSRVFPQIVVLSYPEVEGVQSIQSVATVRIDHAHQEVLVSNGA